MDTSISLVTPAMLRQRGIDAFKRGEAVDSHGMNPGSAGIYDWTRGYMQAHYEFVMAEQDKKPMVAEAQP